LAAAGLEAFDVAWPAVVEDAPVAPADGELPPQAARRSAVTASTNTAIALGLVAALGIHFSLSATA
jgi:hypothetical protein